MLRFEDHGDFVEIALATEQRNDLPSIGDAYLTIRVSSGGFAGHNQVWILGPVLRSFCRSLIALERDRKGEAVIDSISPRELYLSIKAVDSRGHMLIGGTTGFEVQHENSRVWHSVEFGFEFDPSQLSRA